MSDQKVKSNKRQKDSTHMQTDLRVVEVRDFILLGHTRTEILRLTSKWRVSERMIDHYIATARKEIQEVNNLTLEENLSQIVNSLWILFRAEIAKSDTKAARLVLMDIAKVRGLDQQTINHIVEDKRDLANLSEDELESILGKAPIAARH